MHGNSKIKMLMQLVDLINAKKDCDASNLSMLAYYDQNIARLTKRIYG